MKYSLAEINQMKDRVSGIAKDRYAIQDRIELFRTEGKGFYLKNTIDTFALIRTALESMDTQAASEIESLMKKILD